MILIPPARKEVRISKARGRDTKLPRRLLNERSTKL